MFRLFSLIVALAVSSTSAAPNSCWVKVAGVACGSGAAALFPNEAHNCLAGVASEWCCAGTNWDVCGTVCAAGVCAVCTGAAGGGCTTGNGSSCGAGLKVGACTVGGAAASGAWQKASLGLLAMVLPFVVAA